MSMSPSTSCSLVAMGLAKIVGRVSNSYSQNEASSYAPWAGNSVGMDTTVLGRKLVLRMPIVARLGDRVFGDA